MCTRQMIHTAIYTLAIAKHTDGGDLVRRYNLQIDVINQLGQRIENQFRSLETKLTSLPRSEASSLRTTHVKLNRDYRLVEQRFKNVQLDAKRRRGLAEARVREAARAEEEERERKRVLGGANGLGGGEGMTEDAMRWQMQIQEDVSGCRTD